MCGYTAVWAQPHQSVLPLQQGEALRKSLVNDYKPRKVLDYRSARELMYTTIYNEGDSVRCVYSGHALYLAPSEDNPVSELLRFGSLQGIITEHVYPRSKGAREGNAKSDMHHLVPARMGVNVARLNHPFGEVDDNKTERWFYRDKSIRDMPAHFKDAYSEKGYNTFEPREDFKGNVARAVFYFYTMYKTEAQAEDAAFFELQRATLCRWHLLDPVDDKEWARTFQIAQYQDGKPNPFVLDCTLAARVYCSDTPGACIPATDDSGK
ncbi:MAG: endonuclease [Saprospiraceae bacterium]|nr:endonuclease [Saprospiraceae bacterium]